MIGLVLSGGGLKGSYQIGAYKALKKLKIKTDSGRIAVPKVHSPECVI